MKKVRFGFEEYAIHENLEFIVPFPCHFEKRCFTVVAMDDSRNADKRMSRGMHIYDHPCYDTVIVLLYF